MLTCITKSCNGLKWFKDTLFHHIRNNFLPTHFVDYFIVSVLKYWLKRGTHDIFWNIKYMKIKHISLHWHGLSTKHFPLILDLSFHCKHRNFISIDSIHDYDIYFSIIKKYRLIYPSPSKMICLFDNYDLFCLVL